MKMAFSFLEGRIAPVFDTAQGIYIAEVEGGRIVSEARTTLVDQLPTERAMQLVGLSVGTLVCGAISAPMRGALISHGILVFPFIAGNLKEVIQAWIKGGPAGDAYRMPGCRSKIQPGGCSQGRREGDPQNPSGEQEVVRGEGVPKPGGRRKNATPGPPSTEHRWGSPVASKRR